MGERASAPVSRLLPTFALEAADDAAFAACGPTIARYLYANFPGLRGLRQHRPHFHPDLGRTTDPVEHTLEMLALLDTTGLDAGETLTLRAAAVFHDIGKLLDPLNVRHAVDSAALAPPYLADFPLTPDQQAAALTLIATHDVLGRVAQGRIDAEEAAGLFGTRRLAALANRLTRADIGSIRGLTGTPERPSVLPSIAAAYAAIVEVFDARDALARVGSLRPQAKLWLETGGKIALSAWRVALLEAIEETGSLAKAAARMHVPYRTASYKLREIEENLGLRLVATQSGGAAGGGSRLTPEARALVRRWRDFGAGLDDWVATRFRAAFVEDDGAG